MTSTIFPHKSHPPNKTLKWMDFNELSEDDMILSQVLETLEDEMELRNVNIEDFFGEFPSNVMDENASGDLINTSAVSFDLHCRTSLRSMVASSFGKRKDPKCQE
ncbi:uncharacterized protein [Mytilus edulis]|uniref:uncharacterized protein n=1 Tax=Mytilus edulis TaxID=6550 RepID=UPI0039EEF2CF